MPDVLAELQQAILRSIQVQVDEMAAQRGWDDRTALINPANPLGGGAEPMQDVLFTTGYDGTITTTAFMFDASTMDGPDILIGPDLLGAAQADGATYGYRFNEASGNLVNFMGNPTYDLLVDAAVTRSIAGPLGAAYHVPGTGGIAPAYGHVQGTRASQNGIGSITYELIAKFGAGGVGIEIVDGEWVGLVQRFQFGLDGAGNLAGYINGTGGYNLAAPGSASLATQWNHYLWQSDGSTISLYVNGTLAASAASTLEPSDAAGASAGLAFGGLYGVGGSNWNSYFAFFAAYHNVVLSPGQIANHYSLSGCPKP